GEVLANDPYLQIRWRSSDTAHIIKTQITGKYNLENALAAICIGDFFNIHTKKIHAGVGGYVPSNNRSQIVNTAAGNTLICDFYNANANSMLAAIENLEDMASSSRTMILGDMFEMGDLSDDE